MTSHLRLRIFTLAVALGVASSCALEAETIATFPGTGGENIAVSASGQIFATSFDDGLVYRLSPSGALSVFGHAPGPVAGAAFNTDGTLVVAGISSVYRFAPNGAASLVTDIAGAGDLNGLALLAPGSFLVADDAAATIWQVNLSTGSASPWLTGGLLEPGSSGPPIGPNGIKLFGGAVYISNTGAGTILRVPVLPDGSAGTPSIYASGLPLDDFAFGSDGSLFLATQVQNSVIRLSPDGTRTTIATSADGLLGDAALAFGRTAADSTDLYVVNNGGVFENLPGGPQPSSVARIDAGITGVVPESQAIPEPATLWLTAAGLIAALVLMRLKRSRPYKSGVAPRYHPEL